MHPGSVTGWRDPKTGVGMVLVREGGPSHRVGYIERATSSGMHAALEVRYGCGCEWSIDLAQALRLPRAPRTIRDLPQECPRHSAAALQCAHSWTDITRLGDPVATFVCGLCGGQRLRLLPGPFAGWAKGGIVGHATHAAAAGGTISVSLGSIEPKYEPPPELELAFETEPIVGWRTWKLVPFERHGGIKERRLASLTGREVWEPRVRAEGRCLPEQNTYYYDAPRPASHEAPWPSCWCGIWATRERSLSEGEQAKVAGVGVIGQVAMWGRVLEFRRGWRARYAYPVRLILLGGDQVAADELARLYGVPVEVERWDWETAEEAARMAEYIAKTRKPVLSLSIGFEKLSMTAEALNSIFGTWTADPPAPEPPQRRTLPPPRPKPTSRETFKRQKKLGP